MRGSNIIAIYFCIFILFCFLVNYLFLTHQQASPPNLDHRLFNGNHENDILSPLSWLDHAVTVVDPYKIQHFNQNDPRLLNYIRAHHLDPPSNLPYNFNGKFSKYPGGDPVIRQQLGKIFTNKGGFFVECGGYDGIYSETIILEKDQNWSGLLIECNPILTPEIRKVHRKSYLADVCLSLTDHPQMTEIISSVEWPASSSNLNDSDNFPNFVSNFTKYEVQSIPFYSLIAALGKTEVDLIILDVQGVELKILKVFPFDSMLVKVWVIEVSQLSKQDVRELNDLMVRNGYNEGVSLGKDKWDTLYMHKSVSS